MSQGKRVAHAVEESLFQLSRKTLKTAQEPAWMKAASGPGEGDHFHFGIDSVVGLMKAPIIIEAPQITGLVV